MPKNSLGLPESVPAAITRHHRLKQHTFIAHSSGAWRFGVRVPAWWVLGENPPSSSQMAIFLLCPHMVEGRERGSRLSLLSFIRALIPS